MLFLFTKNQHIDIKIFSKNYLRFLISKFRLDFLKSISLSKLYIYEKKTENNEYEIESASNLVDFMSARRK